jgi:methionyl-tRNA formyltransferase
MIATRVVFLGYGRIGCYALGAALDAGIDVVAVVPRASDQGGDPATSVRALAERRDLSYLEVTNPNTESVVAQLSARHPDYILSIQYDRILRPALIGVPRLGCINLHNAPLPRFRGCFPTKWAIIENEPSGVTLHYIDPGIDTGRIIERRTVPLTDDETDQSLYRKLEAVGMSLFGDYVEAIASQTVPAGTPQADDEASYYPKEIPLGGAVAWHRDAVWVERFIRAFTFPPHPAAKTWLDGLPVELRAPVSLATPEAPSLPGTPGSFRRQNGSVYVTCGQGTIRVDELRVAGEWRRVADLVDFPGEGRFRELI